MFSIIVVRDLETNHKRGASKPRKGDGYVSSYVLIYHKRASSPLLPSYSFVSEGRGCVSLPLLSSTMSTATNAANLLSQAAKVKVRADVVDYRNALMRIALQFSFRAYVRFSVS